MFSLFKTDQRNPGGTGSGYEAAGADAPGNIQWSHATAAEKGSYSPSIVHLEPLLTHIDYTPEHSEGGDPVVP